MSNPHKNWLVQKKMALGKDSSNPLMADNLRKIVWFSTHHVSLMKSWLVQKQTALGKDKSNPFTVDSLLKTIWSSIHHHLTNEVLTILGQTTTGKEISNPFMDNDVTRLQALVDKKKVVITEAAIREVLRLDDAEGVDCLPNEEIFEELARMGYEKPSTKLTFYKAFFSSQKQLGDLSTHTTKYTSPALTQKVFANMRRVGKGFSGVKTPLFEGMIVEQVIEEGGAEGEHVKEDIAAQGDDTTAQGDDAQEPYIPSPTPPSPPPQQPQNIPSTSQVQHTPPQSPQPQLQPQPQAQPQAPDFPMSLLQEALDACVTLNRRVEHLEYDKVTQALEIIKLKRRVKKLEKGNKVKVLKLRRLKKVETSQQIDTSEDTVMDDASNQGRIIYEMDKEDAVALMDDKEEEKKEEEAKVVEDDQVYGSSLGAWWLLGIDGEGRGSGVEVVE
nr:hypothetical protein [Tanacetum cinerariifolium]